MSNNLISEKIYNIHKIIEQEDNIKLLRNWFVNINKYKDISDYEKEYLIDATVKKIRREFPYHATKILGGKSAKAQELLEEIFKTLSTDFDWSNNCVGSRVKVGGLMMSGDYYVCYYISYKNKHNFTAELSYNQKTIEEDPCLMVEYRKVGGDKSQDKKQKFSVELSDKAIETYRNTLNKVIEK